MSLTSLKIGARINVMVIGLLGFTAIVGGVGIWTMNKIGQEIVEIAEQDLPLTRAVTEITIHQLEQAILLEKGLAHIDDGAGKTYGDKFAKLGKKVDAEILQAEHMLAEAIDHAHSEAARAEFTQLLEIMKSVETQHKVYEQHGEEMFGYLNTGAVAKARAIGAKAEAEQDALDKQLISALMELESFTQAAALTAERDEIAGIKMLIAISVAALIMGAVLALIISGSITRPLNGLTGVMGRLAQNDTDVDIGWTTQGDEVGAMAQAVEVFRDNAIEVKRLNAAQEEADRQAERDRKTVLDTVAQQIESQIGQIAQKMATASDQVKSSAKALSSDAEQASSQSMTVASASEQAANNVQMVAAAAEELSASVTEISRQVITSTQVSERAVLEVEAANTKVAGLASAAQEIGDVISLINDIAEQTNLLALNATIEAARAGDAGKGFAVVASEVKNLANQTAKATEDISGQIREIQDATGDAVGAINDIGSVIAEISGVTNSIAAAVEEQGAATEEIARNVQEAASGTQDVTASIGQVAAVADNTGKSASDLLGASGEMSSDSQDLNTQVEDLVRKIRAA